MSQLLDKSEVASILKVSARTVDRLRASGALKAVQVRGSVRFSEEAVTAFIEGRPLYTPCWKNAITGEELLNSVEADEPCGTPPFPRTPKTESFCDNPACKARDVKVSFNYWGCDAPPSEPPSMKCPVCGQPLRFETYLSEERLLRVGP
jgi:excisionase family DNA binding protein